MKLDELMGIKHLYNKELKDLLNFFSKPKSDLKFIGKGAIARVFRTSDNYIYKFWIEDKAYEDYVNYCLDNQDNSAVPVFYTPIKTLHAFFKRPSSFPKNIKYIKMEQLKPLNKNMIWPGTKNKSGDKRDIMEIVFFLKNSINEDGKPVYTDGLTFEKWIDKHLEMTPRAKKNLLDFKKVIVDLKNLKNIKNNLDIHSGNIMLRGDQVVLTDPAVVDNDMNLADKIMNAVYFLKDPVTGISNSKEK